MNIFPVEISYHRNGVAGRGFYVVNFHWRDEGSKKQRRMLATVFAEEDYTPNGLLSVLDIDETNQGNIAFAQGNSWRGDDFELSLLRAIQQHDEQSCASVPVKPAVFTDTDHVHARGMGVRL